MSVGLKIYVCGILTGLFSLLKGKIVIGLKRILLPVGYWRYPIFCYAYKQCLKMFKTKGEDIKILDIGSPKLLALYLAINHNCRVYATDLQDEEIWNMWQVYWNCWPKDFKKGRYITEYQDGRNLPYPNEYFDIVFSISVLEHIPNQGDSQTMKEIQRVLKKGGIAIIELPYSLKAYDTFLHQDVYERKFEGKPVFYERHYDEETLYKRIINPASQLKLKEKIIIGERFPFERFWQKVPKLFGVWFYWSEFLISLLNHFYIYKQHIQKDKSRNIKRAMSVTLVFTK